MVECQFSKLTREHNNDLPKARRALNTIERSLLEDVFDIKVHDNSAFRAIGFEFPKDKDLVF